MIANPYASDYLLSPDGTEIAIRRPDSIHGRQGAPWRCSSGSRLRDDQVQGWAPLRTMSLSETIIEQTARRALGEASE